MFSLGAVSQAVDILILSLLSFSLLLLILCYLLQESLHLVPHAPSPPAWSIRSTSLESSKGSSGKFTGVGGLNTQVLSIAEGFPGFERSIILLFSTGSLGMRACSWKHGCGG